MECPKCRGVALRSRTLHRANRTVDYCPQCRGVWFDRAELEALLSVAVKDLSVPPEARDVPRTCPRCGEKLFRFRYPQTYVNVEVCRKCRGLWLDPGELKEIRAVRERLQETDRLDEHPLPTGVKAALLRFIDTAIDDLTH